MPSPTPSGTPSASPTTGVTPSASPSPPPATPLGPSPTRPAPDRRLGEPAAGVRTPDNTGYWAFSGVDSGRAGGTRDRRWGARLRRSRAGPQGGPRRAAPRARRRGPAARRPGRRRSTPVPARARSRGGGLAGPPPALRAGPVGVVRERPAAHHARLLAPRAPPGRHPGPLPPLASRGPAAARRPPTPRRAAYPTARHTCARRIVGPHLGCASVAPTGRSLHARLPDSAARSLAVERPPPA